MKLTTQHSTNNKAKVYLKFMEKGNEHSRSLTFGVVEPLDILCLWLVSSSSELSARFLGVLKNHLQQSLSRQCDTASPTSGWKL